MNALVVVQRGQFLEVATTVVAVVRSFVAVVQQMFVVRLLESERLVAQIASVRRFACQTISNI